jgi:uncharacterized protein YjbJ (UPF0337 family)
MPGRMDEMKGSMKEAVGKAVGNKRLEAEGNAQHDTAKAAREAAGASDQMKGNVKMATGKALGNKRLHAEGQAEDVKGTIKRAG